MTYSAPGATAFLRSPFAFPDLSVTQTLRDLVIETPAVAEVFEQLDIDYFCRGNRRLNDALGEAGVSVDRFRSMFESVGGNRKPANAEPDWNATSIRSLIDHIVGTHHAFLHRELAGFEKWLPIIPGETELSPGLRQTLHCLK